MPAPPHSPAAGQQAAASPDGPKFGVAAVAAQEGVATWYDVPARSLAERRAWPGEMTAASDVLPLNTYVRVRRVGPDADSPSVIVRITDTGIHRHGTLIDLDRPAAEALGMVASGQARVRVERLVLAHADTNKHPEPKGATPSAAEIAGTPAATLDQEKAAAAAKAGGPVAP